MLNRQQENIKIELNSIVERSDNQVAAEIDGEAVMMSVEQGYYYGLDKIGTRIWSLIEQPKSVADILRTLLDEYEVKRETCEQELREFLDLLLENGLIRQK